MKTKRREGAQEAKEANCRATLDRWHDMNRKQQREMMRQIHSEDLSLAIIHPDAAGIDIGNESHYVAVPPNRDSQSVQRFGCKNSCGYPNRSPPTSSSASSPRGSLAEINFVV